MEINDFFSNDSDDNQRLLDFESFKNRKTRAKKIFKIKEISKTFAYNFISKHHYLGEAKFFSKFSYGIFYGMELIGVATYSNPQGASAMAGWFGLRNTDQTVVELSRLCLLPELNGTNATSYLLGNSMKSLKRENNIRAVITLADDERHVGSIYQVCNFKYYGLSDPKSDFYRASDGKGNPRCTTKDKQGVWVQRTRKHRYCFILDKKIKCLYDEVKEKPKQNLETTSKYSCCNGTEVIHDNRFNETWKCPKCTTNGAMRLVNNENSTFNKDKPIGNWFG